MSTEIGITHDKKGYACVYLDYVNIRGKRKRYIGQHAIDTLERMKLPEKKQELVELKKHIDLISNK